MPIRNPQPYTVLLPDLEGFSEGGWPRHGRLQDGLSEVLDEASERAEMSRAQWIRQPTGDGELVLLSPMIPKYRILSDLVHQLEHSLRDYNADKTIAYRLRVRLAVDAGDVHIQNDGNFSGAPPVTVSRLSNSPALKAALHSAPKDLAVIVSDRVYQEAVQHGPRGVDPREYWRVRVSEKTFDEYGWIRVPGSSAEPRHRSESLDEDGDTSRAEPGAPDTDSSAGRHLGRPIAPDQIGSIRNSGAISFGGNANQVNHTNPFGQRGRE